MDTAFLHTSTTTMLLTSCLKVMPVLCLQFQDLKATPEAQDLGATLRPPPGLPLPSSDEDEACDDSRPEQVSHNACASAQSSALGASWLICSLHMVAW